MSDTNTTTRSGMGLAGWLTLVFVVLKLNPGGHLTSPVVDWSWWLVFSPMLIALGIVVAILLVLGLVALIAFTVDEINRKKRRKAAWNRVGQTPPRRLK